jgi:ACS family tartrate transporter-like MFS transporter
LFAAAIAFAWSAGAAPLVLVMLALSIATLGIYAAIGTFWSLPISILTGTGAAAGLALINSIGNYGGFVGSFVVGRLKGATGDFTVALLFLAGALALGGALALYFGYAGRSRRPEARTF